MLLLLFLLFFLFLFFLFLFLLLFLSTLRWAVLTVLWIGFCHSGPISLCLDLFVFICDNVVTFQWAEMRMVRWMCGIKYMMEFQVNGWERLGLDDITSAQQNRLQWYGHVLRIEDNDWVKKCMENEVKGVRPWGRPKKTWREIVEKDCKVRKLNGEDAMDCNRWRKQIRDDDDHNRCERVNVSSGTGSPRLSRTESREPYNGCVCVCACVCVCILCVCFILHMCCIIVSTVGWTWWDCSLILRTYFLSVLSHCCLDHLTHKNPSAIWPIMCLVGC